MISPDKTELAVWRYGIISRLLHRNDDDGPLDNELQQLASRRQLLLQLNRCRCERNLLASWVRIYTHIEYRCRSSFFGGDHQTG